MSGCRDFICWLDGEQFAVLCYTRAGTLVKVLYFDYLFDAQTFCTTFEATHQYDDFEIIRMRLTNITDSD